MLRRERREKLTQGPGIDGCAASRTNGDRNVVDCHPTTRKRKPTPAAGVYLRCDGACCAVHRRSCDGRGIRRVRITGLHAELVDRLGRSGLAHLCGRDRHRPSRDAPEYGLGRKFRVLRHRRGEQFPQHADARRRCRHRGDFRRNVQRQRLHRDADDRRCSRKSHYVTGIDV